MPKRSGDGVRVPKALRGPLLALLGLALGAGPGGDVTAPSSGVDAATHACRRTRVPAADHRAHRRSSARSSRRCGWSPRSRPSRAGTRLPAGDGVGRAAAARRAHLDGGRRGAVAAPDPGPGDPVTDPDCPPAGGSALAVQHPAGRRAPPERPASRASALDAMLVCHVAGCGRVTGSATGVPRAGEAGCDDRCAALVARYLDAVHGYVRRYSVPRPTPPTPAGPARPSPPGPSSHLGRSLPRRFCEPAAWTGGATGCTRSDPTGGRCVTGATRHGLDAVGRRLRAAGRADR